eukprot:CAMPEP_0114594864 /NCGR_PEP_ID=MMETSP0125-20121206/16578_1 /TAXON_ID=485358 ORGANISM="Aristerostoma sp., Strain ATCC 50986" /NCGR_SAMPLE_ID=MMETSP0125 /ASSEMBLY_ACC=CAM_ASM_000245 /LENGTH=146 /DNA_ID=CAMNT_0001795709 /DNA_START=632 /DNA_END=1072 /DNA_ORIENTATION=-
MLIGNVSSIGEQSSRLINKDKVSHELNSVSSSLDFVFSICDIFISDSDNLNNFRILGFMSKNIEVSISISNNLRGSIGSLDTNSIFIKLKGSTVQNVNLLLIGFKQEGIVIVGDKRHDAGGEIFSGQGRGIEGVSKSDAIEIRSVI